MAAHRADPCPRLPEITAQQQQIHDLLDVRSAEPVLGDPHAVHDDNGACLPIDTRHALQLIARQAADPEYVFPCCLAQIVGESLEAVCVLRDKIEIQHRLPAV